MNHNSNFKHLILENFKNSSLSVEDFLTACEQILQAKTDTAFQQMSINEKENYLKENKLFQSFFLGDKNLIQFLSDSSITLLQIFIAISSKTKFADFSDCFFDINSLLQNSNDILLVYPELYLNQIQKICDTSKNITILTNMPKLASILEFDYQNSSNIKIECFNIYNNEENQLNKKYSLIFCVPPFGTKRLFKRSLHFGNDFSSIAAEILMENYLNEQGHLITVLPQKINFSQDEAHFRQGYGGKILKVTNLPSNAFSSTKLKTYLFEFSNKFQEKMIYSNDLSVIGETFNIKDFTEINSRWNFNMPFIEKDKAIQNIYDNKTHSLGDVAYIFRGKPLSKKAKEVDKSGDFLYLDIRSIKDNKIDYSEAKEYLLDKNSSKDYLKDGDILIKNKGNFSQIVMYKNNGKNCIASANLIVIRAEMVNPEILMLYLRNDVVQKLIKSIQRGAALAFINHEDLKSLPIIVPPKEKRDLFISEYSTQMKEYQKLKDLAEKKLDQINQQVTRFICEM